MSTHNNCCKWPPNILTLNTRRPPTAEIVKERLHCIFLTSFKGSITRIVNVAVFVSGTFVIFNVMRKQHHETALNPFLNGTKTVTLTARVNEV